MTTPSEPSLVQLWLHGGLDLSEQLQKEPPECPAENVSAHPTPRRDRTLVEQGVHRSLRLYNVLAGLLCVVLAVLMLLTAADLPPYGSDTAPTVKIELPRNSGDTKVEIPGSNVKPGTVAVLVHPDGTKEIVKNSLPTADGIQLTVNGGATVKIVDNSKDFIDTQDHWAKDAIDFVSARGLVNGMNDSIYAPDASTTRAQLWTILARQNNADLTGGATWFENAQNWAKEKGISDGMNPNGTINRAQMVTMLWRAMGQPAPTAAATFTDVSADSYYAQAVAWAIENGITTGVGGGRFDPNSTCTRAQIATFLYRLYLSR